MRHLVRFLLASLFVVFIACGRSGLDDYALPSGTSDSGTCGPETCPTGCCDETGQCRAGNDLTRCGSGGRSCNNCPANGADTCSDKVCGTKPPSCNAATCPNGCCAVRDGAPVCLTGTDDAACGTRGEACDVCASQGLSCNIASRTCGGTVCNATNCKGCCVGNQCLQGVNNRSCGQNGAQCTDCRAQGQTCVNTGTGGRCAGGPPVCNAATCPTGCCRGNVCLPGSDNADCGTAGAACRSCGMGTACDATRRTCAPVAACGPENCAGCCIGDVCVNPGNGDTSCGTMGQACANCTGKGQVCRSGSCVNSCSAATCPNGCCQNGVCVAGGQDSACGTGGVTCTDCTNDGRFCGAAKVCRQPCGPANCAGCCQGNVCNAGFVNARCGSGGAACSDCAALGQSCDVNANPRVCAAAGTCPSAYGMCPAGTSTPVPVPQTACPAFSLQDARVACAAGPNSPACVSFFQFLNLNDPACSSCLSPFRYDFGVTDGRGVYACVAPYVDGGCNISTGCAADCENTSCAQCTSSAANTACRASVRGNQCQSFVLATTCVTPALLGAGAFCNPATYGGSFGAWLEGVGGRYCNP